MALEVTKFDVTDEYKKYRVAPMKGCFSLFKFFCCCCCCCFQWDSIVGLLKGMHKNFKNIMATWTLLGTLYSDWYMVDVFHSYLSSHIEHNADSAETLGNFIAIMTISGITVVVLLTKLYTKGPHGKIGKKDGQSTPVEKQSSPVEIPSSPIEGKNSFGIHTHYLQHIAFARIIYIPLMWMGDKSNESSDAFLLATTSVNMIFSILKVFLKAMRQNDIAFVCSLLRLIFSILSFLENMLIVAINLSKDDGTK